MTKKTYLLKFTKVAVFLVIGIVIYKIYGLDSNKTINNPLAKKAEIVVCLPKETELKDSVVNFGLSLLGTPYQTAGSSLNGFDCSGYVFFVFNHFKIKVPRSTTDFEFFGTEIPIDKVEKGDLLLFLSPSRGVIGHIGIVSNPNGMASDFIHSTSGKSMSVVKTALTNAGYTKRFVKAIRVLN